MQPCSHRAEAGDQPGATCQDQKRRLCGVLRLVLVAQDPPAGPQDHRPVAVDDRRERGLRRLGRRVPAVDKPLQQLAVGQANGRALPPECFDLLVDRRASACSPSDVAPPRLCLPWSARRPFDYSRIPRDGGLAEPPGSRVHAVRCTRSQGLKYPPAP